MKKLLTLIFLIIIVVLGINVGLKVPHSLSEKTNLLPSGSVKSDQSSVSPVESVKVGIPKTLRIPKINLDANIESVGLAADKSMDVPKNSDDVGWYNLGVKPGEKGNAVLDGHLDKSSGAPAVFWNVAKLTPGDKIIVTDSNGKDNAFLVTKKTEYPYNDFPLQTVFGPTDKYMLNLISCNGAWNSTTHNYSHRTVVYSELVK